MVWIKGNVPKDTEGFYWIAVKSNDRSLTYPFPCRYSEDDGWWVDFKNHVIGAEKVVAHYPIIEPKSFDTIGSGVGYYIKAVYENNESIFGFGLQPANWVMKGYKTVEKAVSAARRLKHIDIEEKVLNAAYSVLDGKGNTIKTLK